MPTGLRSEHPTARKEHRCSLCGGVIVKGETYHRQTNIYDGSIYDFLTCLGCGSILSDVYEWCGYPDEGVETREADEWAYEHHDDPRAEAYLLRRRVT